MKWINVKDGQPNHGDDVLIIDKNNRMAVATYNSSHESDQWRWYTKHCCGRELNIITHWIPLPEPPKDEK